MTDKELRKLGRADLLELLLEQSKENDSLSERLTAASSQYLELKKQVEELTEELMKTEEKLTQTEQVRDEYLTRAETAEAKLGDREILLNEAGSIAEAAMKVNGIFEAAEATAKQYLDNIRTLSDRESAICEERERENRETCERMLLETKNASQEKLTAVNAECEAKERSTREACDSMKKKAMDEAENYWKVLAERLENFYESHTGLREMLEFFHMELPSFENKKPE